jgi:hypothetical protein
MEGNNLISITDLADTIHKVASQQTTTPGKQALWTVVDQLGTRLKAINGGKFDQAGFALSCGITEGYKTVAA